VNVDGVWTAADVIILLNFVFKGGPAPLPCVAIAFGPGLVAEAVLFE